MAVLLLVSVVFGVSMQSILKKPYSIKTGGRGVFIFNSISSLAAMTFFIVTSGGLSFNLSVLPYSIAFSIAFSITSVASVLCIAYGSLSLTSLFTSYSLMIPTFYGLIFRHDEIGVGLIPGLILLCLSLFVTNIKKGDSQITLKWLICVFIAFVGNGMCSVIQSIQQIDFERQYKNEFMIVAYLLCSIIMLILAFAREKNASVGFVKNGWPYALFCGLFNGMVNLFVILLQGMMQLSVMFPIISAGGIIVTFLFSVLYYKEKLSKLQLVGFLLGTISVVLLNI